MPILTDTQVADFHGTINSMTWQTLREFTAADGAVKYPLNCDGYDQIKIALDKGAFTTVSLDIEEEDADGAFAVRDPSLSFAGLTADQVLNVDVHQGVINIKVAAVVGAGTGKLSVKGIRRWREI